MLFRSLLANEEGKRVLYYINDRYEAYRAQTPLDYDAPWWPEAPLCYMGYEKEATQSIPYTLLPEHQTSVTSIAVRTAQPLDGYRRAVMTRLDINPELRSYPSVDGSDVYVDDLRSVSFFPDGQVVYLNPAEEVPIQDASVPTLVETVRLLAAEMEAISGAARIRLSAMDEQPEGTHISFAYVCNGLTVQGAPALYALFEGTVLRELTMRPLYFETTDDTVFLLPIDVAVALAGGPPGRYTLSLCYGLDGQADYYPYPWKGR